MSELTKPTLVRITDLESELTACQAALAAAIAREKLILDDIRVAADREQAALQRAEQLQKELNELHPYSYAVVRGAVDWRDKQIAELTVRAEQLSEALTAQMKWIGPPPTDPHSFDSVREDAWEKSLFSLRAARQDEQLPTLNDLRGIAPDIIPGEMSEDFVRRMRDEWDTRQDRKSVV